jgi:hypothetical protein
MLRNLLLLGCVLVVATPLQAVETAISVADERTKLALELMQLVHFDRTITAVQAQVRTSMEGQLQPLAKCEAARPVVAEFGAKLADKTVGSLGTEEFKVDVAAIYAEVFNEDELKQIIAFYQSPLGAKLLERMPQLMQKSMQVTQDRVKTMMPEVQELGETYRRKVTAACGATADRK